MRSCTVALCRYTLVTPMLANDCGKAVLVMRGWVPAVWKTDPAVREGFEPAGQV